MSGTIDRASTAFARPCASVVDCPKVFGLDKVDPCQIDWVEIPTNLNQLPAMEVHEIKEGFSTTFRLFVPDMCKGVALNIEMSAGTLMVIASASNPVPDLDNYDWMWSVGYGRRTLTICPSDPVWNTISNSKTGTIAFALYALTEAYVVITADIEVEPLPLPNNATQSKCWNDAIPDHVCIFDSTTVYCSLNPPQNANSTHLALPACTLFQYRLPPKLQQEASQSCVPILIFMTSKYHTLFPIKILLSKVRPYLDLQSADIVEMTDSIAISLCVDETLFVGLTGFSNEPDLPPD